MNRQWSWVLLCYLIVLFSLCQETRPGTGELKWNAQRANLGRTTTSTHFYTKCPRGLFLTHGSLCFNSYFIIKTQGNPFGSDICRLVVRASRAQTVRGKNALFCEPILLQKNISVDLDIIPGFKRLRKQVGVFLHFAISACEKSFICWCSACNENAIKWKIAAICITNFIWTWNFL